MLLDQSPQLLPALLVDTGQVDTVIAKAPVVMAHRHQGVPLIVQHHPTHRRAHLSVPAVTAAVQCRAAHQVLYTPNNALQPVSSLVGACRALHRPHLVLFRLG